MKIINRIFRDKKSNTVIYIILAMGILMLVCANSAEKNNPYEITDTAVAESSLNVETERILSEINGVGNVSVMISETSADNKENEGKIQSVLVVADGGNNPAVCEKIIRALKVALGVDAHKIEVFERKERK